MLSLFTVKPHTLELLRRLQAEPLLSDTRLVGGTSLALQYGHRESIDLDLFGHIDCDDLDLRDRLQNIASLQVIKETKNIKLYILDGIKVDIVNYAYSWLDAPLIEEGLRLATPKDIAAMKLNAVIGRGTKKDFIDLYFLLEHYSLDEILELYKTKYSQNSLLQAGMSLAYFADAENDAMPVMHIPVTWQTIKSQITKAVTSSRLL